LTQQLNADELEVVPGFEHEKLEGSVWESASETELLDALEKAFSYRGDVTITLRGGLEMEGYLFDRSFGSTLADSKVRLILKSDSRRATVLCSEITGLKFSGRDTAAGKSWEAWVKKYWEKKAAGEKNIQLAPEALE
jgi:hypothetical protein